MSDSIHKHSEAHKILHTYVQAIQHNSLQCIYPHRLLFKDQHIQLRIQFSIHYFLQSNQMDTLKHTSQLWNQHNINLGNQSHIFDFLLKQTYHCLPHSLQHKCGQCHLHMYGQDTPLHNSLLEYLCSNQGLDSLRDIHGSQNDDRSWWGSTRHKLGLKWDDHMHRNPVKKGKQKHKSLQNYQHSFHHHIFTDTYQCHYLRKKVFLLGIHRHTWQSEAILFDHHYTFMAKHTIPCYYLQIDCLCTCSYIILCQDWQTYLEPQDTTSHTMLRYYQHTNTIC